MLLLKLPSLFLNLWPFRKIYVTRFIARKFSRPAVTLKLHSLNKTMLRMNVFATYFAWNRYLLISEWFLIIVQKFIKIPFHMNNKILIKVVWRILKQNKVTILWLLLYVPNREVMNISFIPLMFLRDILQKL